MCSGPLSMQTKGALPSYRLESVPHGVAMSVKFLLRPHISTGSRILQARAALPSYRLPLVCQRSAHLPKSWPMSRRCRLLVAHRGHGEDALPIVPPDRGETEKAAAGCPRRRRLRQCAFLLCCLPFHSSICSGVVTEMLRYFIPRRVTS